MLVFNVNHVGDVTKLLMKFCECVVPARFTVEEQVKGLLSGACHCETSPPSFKMNIMSYCMHVSATFFLLVHVRKVAI